MRISKPPISWPVIAAGAAIASLSVLARRLNPRHHGSQTNAHDAVDDVELRANPTTEEVIDAGVKQTFPASDPVAVQSVGETAFEKKEAGEPHPPVVPDASPTRSADWMLQR